MPPYSDRLIAGLLLYSQAILTALHRDTALLRPPYCGTPTVLRSDFDLLVSGYRLAQTALLRDPSCAHKQYIDRLVSGYRLT